MPARKTSRAQEKRRVVNRQVRSSTRTAVKKAVRLLDAKTDATAEVLHAVSALDRAGARLTRLDGIRYAIISDNWRLSRDLSVNYLATAVLDWQP